ncbi:hypothetical protein LTR12_002378 [Friedmanniomyces endolithicus]|nr:hypothetical protein LTR74_000757 [Friedmanniomyces endolithicus]KAK1823075.1 hypothetical protein LTR12_002378 [Friedmanniomyces endolithicus]
MLKEATEGEWEVFTYQARVGTQGARGGPGFYKGVPDTKTSMPAIHVDGVVQIERSFGCFAHGKAQKAILEDPAPNLLISFHKHAISRDQPSRTPGLSGLLNDGPKLPSLLKEGHGLGGALWGLAKTRAPGSADYDCGGQDEYSNLEMSSSIGCQGPSRGAAVLIRANKLIDYFDGGTGSE